ncbi:MAG: hypothetical protein K8R35_00980, partial [Bacteroidales bacterium]|nr:hypothetical protein [Bacteroidales bacterium]
RWDDLTVSAREAIDMGNDYYYMRMRMGISLYERKRYLQAIQHFRKALEFNNEDQVALEYLFYCYLFSGRLLNAYVVSNDFSTATIKKTGINQYDGNRISVDYMFNNSMSDDLVADYTTLNGYGDHGNLIIPKSFANFGVSLSHKLNNTVSLFHSLSHMKKENMLFYNDGSLSVDNSEQRVIQYQYYISLNISNNKGLVVSPAINYLYTNYPLIYIDGTGMNPTAYSYKIAEHSFVSGLSFNQNLGMVDIGASFGYTYLNRMNNVQGSAELLFRPLANNNLYFGLTMNYLTTEIENKWEGGPVYEGLMGFSFAEKAWFDLSVLYGGLKNFTDRNGFIVYNGICDIDYILKADIKIPFSDSGVWLYFGGRYFMEYTSFLEEGLSYSTIENNSINSISISGGLSWTF